MVSTTCPRPAGRGRGRPIGSDSAETRTRILHAAREVITERGYRAASFQAIADRAELSRPTMHYYFKNRDEIYHSLVQEAQSLLAECVAHARREGTLLKQLAAFASAAHRLNFTDRSMMRFVTTTGVEYQDLPSLRTGANAAIAQLHEFYAWMVDDAIERGEIPTDVDAAAVVNMLLATFWGMGFYAGFVGVDGAVPAIAKQLHRFLAGGLLADAQSAIKPDTQSDIA